MALPPGATISAVTRIQTSTAPGACKVSFRHSFYHSGPARPVDRSRQRDMAVDCGRAVLSGKALGLIVVGLI